MVLNPDVTVRSRGVIESAASVCSAFRKANLGEAQAGLRDNDARTTPDQCRRARYRFRGQQQQRRRS